MNRYKLQGMASRLFYQYDLLEWQVRFKNFVHTLGQCDHNNKTIFFNEFYIEHNDEIIVVDTLLHEIAHALTPGQGHNRIWQRQAILLGATPKACHKVGVKVRPGKYQATCPMCGNCYQKHRKPKYQRGYYCPICGVVRGQLVFTRNNQHA